MTPGPRHTYHPVSIRLSGLVDWIYVYRCQRAHAVSLGGSVLPQLCWPVAGLFGWRLAAGSLQSIKAPRAVFPCSSAVSVESWGATVLVGVGMFPEGWSALMPLPAAALADEGEDLASLWGPHAGRPLDLDPQASDRDLAAAVNDRLLDRLAETAGHRRDPRTAIIAAWANGARQDIDALKARLGVSHRHLDRITLAAFGVGPRRLANKHRILRIAAGMAAGVPRDVHDAWTEGYADQPHFIRSFRHFIGATPTRFAGDPDLFVAEVMRARVQIASRHPLGLFIR